VGRKPQAVGGADGSGGRPVPASKQLLTNFGRGIQPRGFPNVCQDGVGKRPALRARFISGCERPSGGFANGGGKNPMKKGVGFGITKQTKERDRGRRDQKASNRGGSG